MDRVRELYQLYKEPIFRYFLRMTGDWEEAGELTQEVFFKPVYPYIVFVMKPL